MLYPKGFECIDYEKETAFLEDENNFCSYTQNVSLAEIVIITYGRISYQAYKASELLKDKYSIGIIKLKRIFPLDYNLIDSLTINAKLIYVVEEAIMSGGVGEKLSANLKKDNKIVFVRAIEDYIAHGSMKNLLEDCKLTDKQLAEENNQTHRLNRWV